MLDEVKARREFIRWVLLMTLNNARPNGTWEEVMLSVVQGCYADATRHELRRELEYVSDRGLVNVKKHPDGRWFGNLTRDGIDVVEYTTDVEPGIARPQKF